MDGLAEYCGQHAYTQLSWNDIPRDLGRSPGSDRRDWDGERRFGVLERDTCASGMCDSDRRRMKMRVVFEVMTGPC